MSGSALKQAIGEVFLELGDALEGRVPVVPRVRVGLTLSPNEVGREELVRGAVEAVLSHSDIEVVLIGPEVEGLEDALRLGISHVPAGDCERDLHQAMETLLKTGEIQAAVTMHFNFPLGTATVGRVVTPGKGREMFIATTTGTSDADRVKAMVKNALAGIACAKACGIARPKLGILNVEGARMVERILRKLQSQGYDLEFATSVRSDGGAVMRGNDLLAGACDVMVTDSLTGNILMKVFSSFTTGGEYEALGYGYGPGIGETYGHLVFILSRASGAPVVAGAIRYAAQAAQGKVLALYKEELARAKGAGLEGLWDAEEVKGEQTAAPVPEPPRKPVSEEIPGIDILELEPAVRALWKAGIYAASGMGCTGPVILVAPEDAETARSLLRQEGYI
ncbi:MAG: glycine reductase [Thermoanaerobacteraceae bacterium]|nr:glycine reductase [Thermoanaerobacteraceae bacterium]